MYRLYVDEVGTDDLVHLEKDKHRYLSLTQLCDLIAHPSHMYTRLEMAHQVSFGNFSNQVLDALIERKNHGLRGQTLALTHKGEALASPDGLCTICAIDRRSTAP